MHTKKRLLALTLLAAASLLTQRGNLHAQIFTETLDAGSTLASAARPTSSASGGRLDAIVGSLSSAADTDVYAFTVTSASTFSATVYNTTLDTEIYLFNSTGRAVVANDDTNGITLASTIPGGNSFLVSLSPGTYYLAIGLSGNEPVNTANQRLFNAYTGGDTTSLRGAASGTSPATLSGFDGQFFNAESGSYQINLTSAVAVPEPSAWALCLAGAALLGLTVKRRMAQPV